jgi:redox-sensing transcriptional repressor
VRGSGPQHATIMPWHYEIPEATVARYTRYLGVLREAGRAGQQTVSSEEIAEGIGVNAAQVRKDLSYCGELGKRGVGYTVADLQRHLERVLGVEQEQSVVVVGAGNIGSALVGYAGFRERGFRVAGVFDSSPDRIGRRVHGREVLPMSRLESVVRGNQAKLAIVAVPSPAAQGVVDALVEAGISCILNMAPGRVRAPQHVVVRHIDTTTELEVLSFCLKGPGVRGK